MKSYTNNNCRLTILFLLLSLFHIQHLYAEDTYYEQCTSVSDIKNGEKYIIVIYGSNTYYAVKQNNNNAVKITPQSDGTIMNPDSLIIWTAESISVNKCQFACNGKFIYNGTSQLSTVGTKKTTWLISSLTAGINTFKLNDSSSSGQFIGWDYSNKCFKTYANSNFYNQFEYDKIPLADKIGALYIYKLKNTHSLISLSISGSLTKTSYEVGDKLDYSGLTVTGTYDDSTSADVTSKVSWSSEPAVLTDNTKSVVVTAMCDSILTTTTFDVTVRQSEKRVMSWDLSSSSHSSSSKSQVVWSNSVAEMVLDRAESSADANHHLGSNDNSYTTFSGSQSLTITPLNNCKIKEIVFTCTTPSQTTGLFATVWSNATVSRSNTHVTLTPTDGADPVSGVIGGAANVVRVDVVYVDFGGGETTVRETITTNANGVTSYVTKHKLDFSNVDGLTAYVAMKMTSTSVRLAKATVVSAGDALVVRGDASTEYHIPVTEVATPDGYTNIFQASDGTKTAGEIGQNVYCLNTSGVFQKVSESVTIPKGKAYLVSNTEMGAKTLTLDFNDEATGIVELMNNDNNSSTSLSTNCYNLQGQRILPAEFSKSARGIIIVNGRKIVCK